jgi:hypothetical protein
VAGERNEGAGGSWFGLHLGVSLGEVGRPVVLVTGRVGCLPSSPPPGIAAGKSGRNRVGHNQSINQSITCVGKPQYGEADHDLELVRLSMPM